MSQDTITKFLNQCRINYLAAKEANLTEDILKQTGIDYFRMLLIKNKSFNAVKFKEWALNKKDDYFYALAIEDIEHLMLNKFLKTTDSNNYSFQTGKLEKLLSYQKQIIVKNHKRISLLEKLEKDDDFNKNYLQKLSSFKQELKNDKEEILRFLDVCSKFHYSDFSNTVSIFLDTKDKKHSFIKPLDFWENLNIDAKEVKITEPNKAIESIFPIENNGSIVAYAKKKFYDISHTSLKSSSYSFSSPSNDNEVLTMLKNAIKSSNFFKDISIPQSGDLRKDFNSINNAIAEYLFFDNNEQGLFKYLFSKSFEEVFSLPKNIDLRFLDDKNIYSKLESVVSSLNMVSNELLIVNMPIRAQLDTKSFYKTLGEKNSINNINIIVEEKNKEEYNKGVDAVHFGHKESELLALDILKSEDLDIKRDWENLFYASTKLTINSGEYAGLSFCIEEQVSEDDLLEKIAKTFFAQIIRNDLIENKNNIQGRYNEFTRNAELFSREHSNIDGESHGEISSSGISENERDRRINAISHQEERDDNESTQHTHGAGIQRERSDGAVEDGNLLLKKEEINSFFKGEAYDKASPDLIRNAEFIKNKTGLNYKINHYQSATFETKEMEFDFTDAKYGYSLLLPIGKYKEWSVKERWCSSNLNRKQFIESINKTVVEEQKRELFSSYKEEFKEFFEINGNYALSKEDWDLIADLKSAVVQKSLHEYAKLNFEKIQLSAILETIIGNKESIELVNFFASKAKEILNITTTTPKESVAAKTEPSAPLNTFEGLIANYAIMGSFVQTQTKEELEVFTLDKELSKNEYIEFSKFLNSNGLAYYSRVAKGFIIKDMDKFNAILGNKEELEISNNSSINEDKKETLSCDGLKIGESIDYNNEHDTFIGKNSRGYDLFIDKNNEIFFKDDFETRWSQKNFLNGVANAKSLNKNDRFGLSQHDFSPKAIEVNPELLLKGVVSLGDISHSSVETENYIHKNFDFFMEHKEAFSDLLDSHINKRVHLIGHALGMDNFKTEWLLNTSFEKNSTNTNNVEALYFGIREDFSDVYTLIESIKNTNRYKQFIKEIYPNLSEAQKKSEAFASSINTMLTARASYIISAVSGKTGKTIKELNDEGIYKSKIVKEFSQGEQYIYEQSFCDIVDSFQDKELYINEISEKYNNLLKLKQTKDAPKVAYSQKFHSDEIPSSARILNGFNANMAQQLKGEYLFEVVERINPTGDKYSMQIVDLEGKVVLPLGSHVAIENAKKYFNNNFFAEVLTADEDRANLLEVQKIAKEKGLKYLNIGEGAVLLMETLQDGNERSVFNKLGKSTKDMLKFVQNYTATTVNKTVEKESLGLSKEAIEAEFKKHNSKLELFKEFNGKYTLLLNQNIVLSVVLKSDLSLEDANEFLKSFDMKFYNSDKGYYDESLHKEQTSKKEEVKSVEVLEKQTDENLESKEEEILKETVSDIEIALMDSEVQRKGFGAKSRFKDNINALEVIEKIKRNEMTSKEDLEAISKYVGWGGLPQAFYRADGSCAAGWENEAAELKGLLDEEEYDSIRRTVLDSFYTDETISSAMWQGLKRFGFEGGKIVEPSMGIGGFLKTMPKELKNSSTVIGVELDRTTSLIAKTLHPAAQVFNMGFEDFQIEKNSVAVVIGNPPFGGHKIVDRNNKEIDGMTIHNYFLCKSIDTLEQGGVMAMVVSNSFLDSSDTKAKEYIAQNANLVGAIRLPNNAFSKNANTEVTTDILFFQKHNGLVKSNKEEWLEISSLNDTPINKYFVDNPKNLLGEWGRFGTMYQGGLPALVAKEDQDTKALLLEAIKALPTSIKEVNGEYQYCNDGDIKIFAVNQREVKALVQSKQNITVENGDKIRVNSYFIHEDEICMRLPDVNNEMRFEKVTTKTNSYNEEVALTDKEIQRIKGMIKISEIGNNLKQLQITPNAVETELVSLRNKLNDAYDSFIKEFGFLNNQTNARLFEEDVNSAFLLALETKYDKGISPTVAKKSGITPVAESAHKADIFFKRTQNPYQSPTVARDYVDALSISLSEKAFIDLGYMSRLLSKDEEDITSHLSSKGLIFNDPVYGWVTKDEYLSGNVKEKLKLTNNPRNIEALEGVIPKDIEAIDISVSCGEGWIPNSDVEDFINTLSGYENAQASYVESLGRWSVSTFMVSSDKEYVYGTSRKKAADIIVAALNNKQVVVYDVVKDGNGDSKKVVNEDETSAANDKIDLVKEEWENWIWQTRDRRERLARLYNDKFNVFAKGKYDGSHLTLPGKISDDVILLRPHQKNFVWRVLKEGKAYGDHTVGSGKTYSSITAVMELKRTNKAKKALVVVPNHLVGQWAREWMELYPNANILKTTEKDFSSAKRKVLMQRIATGDYDAVIIGHSQLSLIKNDAHFEARFLKQQVADIQIGIDTLRKEAGKGSMGAKQLEKTKNNVLAKIDSLLNAPKDDNITFSELGVDCVVVDEAHEFKNLGFQTSLQRIKGLGNPIGSKKAFDMFLKTQYLLEKTGGKNLIFLSGTPISNSIAEMFTIQRFFSNDVLRSQGLGHFDSWVKQFGDISTDWELSASGKYKLSTRLSKFKKMPELLAFYNCFADVVTMNMVKEQLLKEGRELDIPAVKGGAPANIIIDRTPLQAEFIGEEDEEGEYPTGSLVYRSDNLPKGKPKKGDDNMLVIMSDARKASLDMRIINPEYADFADTKVNRCIEDSLKIYEDFSDVKGTQIIFCDLSTPNSVKEKEWSKVLALTLKAEKGDENAVKELDKYSDDDIMALKTIFSVYDDIKAKLIAKGINEKEIAFIHDANTRVRKDELFERVNNGDVRYILGSTSKMGAGTNIQKRLVALHHIDVPWRPSDLEQREGRIIRPGNLLYTFYKEAFKEEYNIDALVKNEKFLRVGKELGLVDANNTLNEAGLKRVDLLSAEKSLFEVIINRYATLNTLDSGLWEKIETKARFMEQIKNGNLEQREVEDIAGESMNAAEMKAAASGNPLILEEMKLKTEIKKLNNIKKSFQRSLFDREATIASYELFVNSFDKTKNTYEKDFNKIQAYEKSMLSKTEAFEAKKALMKSQGESLKDLKAPSGFEIKVGNQTIANREVAGAFIISKARENLYKFTSKQIKELSLGSYADMEILLAKDGYYKDESFSLIIKGENEYIVDFDIREQKPSGLTAKMEYKVKNIDSTIAYLEKKYERYCDELPKLKSLSGEFSRENELSLLKQRYSVVINELKAKDKKKEVSVDENISVEATVKNEWVDNNKEATAMELLKKRKVDIDLFENMDFIISNNYIVINEEVERSTYLGFAKLCESFGGEWNKKTQALHFSDDGIKRMIELFPLKKVDLDSLVDEEKKSVAF